jgi:hypothetical protein
MRVLGRGAAAAVAALVAGVIVSFIAAALVRSAAPGEQILSRVAPTPKLAVWTFAAAHGVPVEVVAGAEVEGEPLRRIGEIFGRDELGTGASLAVRLAPMTLLAIVALILMLSMREPGLTPADAAGAAASAGVIYGAGLALVAASAGSWAGLDGRIVRFGVGASVSPVYAFVAGAVWAALFSAVGALSHPIVRAQLSMFVRGVWAGGVRSVLVAASASTGALTVLGVAQAGEAGGIDLDPKLAGAGLALFVVNLIATGVVLSFGVPMDVAFSAGPLARFTSIGYVPAGAELSPARWVFVVVPILTGLYAGRAMRKHIARSDAGRAAVCFGVLWGVVLAVLALLLRVRVLSSFDIAAIQAGGGATINAVVAFVLGTVIAGVLSYVGLVTGRAEPAAQPAAVAVPQRPRTCDACGSAVPAGDSFCGVCGRPVAAV